VVEIPGAGIRVGDEVPPDLRPSKRGVSLDRTKVFVSYSREDAAWLSKVKQHLAVLERSELLELWADTRIAAGTNWEEELELALAATKVAVLMISPAFLASEFIWKRKMPRIEAHAAQGMIALPLIIKPCAWRLEGFLARLMARPSEGLALSLGSESQVDFDLSAFAYELAAMVGRSPAAPPRSQKVSTAESASAQANETHRDLTGAWAGSYNDTLAIRLLIRETDANFFQATMEYPREGTTTHVEGTIHPGWSRNDPIWAQIDTGTTESDRVAVSFRETRYQRKGSSNISFNGEYRGFATENHIAGAWFSGTRLVGLFKLQRL
jgi:hypothetical protein